MLQSIIIKILSFLKKHIEAIVVSIVTALLSIFGATKIMARHYEKQLIQVKEALRKVVAERDALDTNNRKNTRKYKELSAKIEQYEALISELESKIAEQS